MEEFTKNIVDLFKSLQKSMASHLPFLKAEVDALIKSKTRDENKIEHMLDNILDLTALNVGNDLYLKLLDYCETVNPEAAAYYRHAYDHYGEE